MERANLGTRDPSSVPDEGGAKGMLRDAITKVMEEITHHEKEARRHVKQAEALKRDLRESFAFLQERRGGKRREEPPEQTNSSASASEQVEAKPAEASTPGPRPSSRRKRRGRKGKKA
jgi:hypothetical protein